MTEPTAEPPRMSDDPTLDGGLRELLLAGRDDLLEPRAVSRVGEGTAMVDKAGVTMTEVVRSIGRVTHIIAEITAASSEQSQGVAQVGEAVMQMDRGTQQNASLVEQSAAAAESLKQQAQQLVQAVAVFKLSPG